MARAMLFIPSMKIHAFAAAVFALAVSPALVAVADPAPRGPDFTDHAPTRGADRSVTPSDATNNIEPYDDLEFATDSTRVADDAADQIARAARWLRAHGGYRIVVEGHADATGTNDYNKDLAYRRAAAVRDRLIDAGIPAARIVLVTCGENGATGAPSGVDRRVVLYASTLAPDAIQELSVKTRGAIRQ